MPPQFKTIAASLAALENRRPQLEGLHCSIQLYADGTGLVLDGQENELAVIHQSLKTIGEYCDVIDKIPRGE